MPHFAAPDLGLHCMLMSHKKDARLISVYFLHARNFFMIFCHLLIFLFFLSGILHHRSGEQTVGTSADDTSSSSSLVSF